MNIPTMNIPPMNIRIASTLLTILFLASAALAQSQDHPLKAFGFGPAAEDVRRCLAGFVPNANRQAAIDRLIDELGDESYKVRERAYAKLAEQPQLPRAQLQAAAVHGDAEVKGRIEQLLKIRSQEHADKMLHAALRQIIQLRLEGLTPDVLAATKSTDFESFWPLLSEALLVSSTKGDAKLLAEALNDTRPDLRAAAAMTLVHVQGADAAGAVKVLLTDPDEGVALAVAKALANVGHRDCLAPLVRLLSAKKIGIRLGAVQTLRALSGKRFGYQTSGWSISRSTAITAWRTWSEGEGQTAKLRFPIEE